MCELTISCCLRGNLCRQLLPTIDSSITLDIEFEYYVYKFDRFINTDLHIQVYLNEVDCVALDV